MFQVAPGYLKGSVHPNYFYFVNMGNKQTKRYVAF